MLIKLTHPNEDIWIDFNEIALMALEKAPTTTLLVPNQKPRFTAVLLKNGKSLFCSETPDQIIAMSKTV